uniref:Uncharacterized protein LOC114334887 n=1 Tax=Diabrotica virgifera virgifera TaxID=50390 RepID=A0A6P7G8F6_DIAVI
MLVVPAKISFKTSLLPEDHFENISTEIDLEIEEQVEETQSGPDFEKREEAEVDEPNELLIEQELVKPEQPSNSSTHRTAQTPKPSLGSGTSKLAGRMEISRYSLPIVLLMEDIPIVAALNEKGHVLDGQGELYWDHLGGKGIKKPKFIRLQGNNSRYENIYLKNCPVHCASVAVSNSIIDGWLIDVSEGDKFPYFAGEQKQGPYRYYFSLSFIGNKNIRLQTTSIFECLGVEIARVRKH